MSQSTGVAAAPGVVGAAALPRNPDPHGATAPAAAPGRFGALTASVRRSLAGTPGRMRVVAALAVVVTLAFGLGAGQAFRSASGALERAGANAAQVVRVQDIRTNLVRISHRTPPHLQLTQRCTHTVEGQACIRPDGSIQDKVRPAVWACSASS